MRALRTGLHEDVSRQLCDEEAPAHARAARARVRRVWQGVRRELEAEASPTGPHWRETVPGNADRSK